MSNCNRYNQCNPCQPRTGLQGVAGPPGTSASPPSYAYFTTDSQGVNVLSGEPIYYEKDVGTSDITGTTLIRVDREGDYEVTFDLSGPTGNRFDIEKNFDGAVVYIANFPADTDDKRNYGQAVVHMERGDTVSIVNYTPPSGSSVYLSDGSLIIKRLGPN
jgi:hypothetical protein